MTDTAAEWEAAFRAADTTEQFRWALQEAELRGQRPDALRGFIRSTYPASGHVPAPAAPVEVETCPWCHAPEGTCGCHEIFLANLATGHDFAEYVAARLRAAGLPAEATPMEVRDNLADRHRFKNEVDVTVGARRVEVKSTSRAWTCIADLPFPAMFVDTVHGWERKDQKPCAVVLISQPTHALAVVPASTRPHWEKTTTTDQVRGIEETFWKCPNRHLRTFDEFVDWLKDHP